MSNVLESFQSLPFKLELITRGKDTHIYVVLSFYEREDEYWKTLCRISSYQLTNLVDLLVRAINILSSKYQKTDWGYKTKENE